MSLIVSEMYTALRAAGVSEEMSRDAARAVVPVEHLERLATKADIAELKAELLKWGVITAFGLLASLSVIIGVLIRFGTVAR